MLTFNRTSMELKLFQFCDVFGILHAFNRTSMELKPAHRDNQCQTSDFLLIEPVWN